MVSGCNYCILLIGVYNNSLSLPLRDNGAGLNNSLRSLAIQQCNEVTPQQHSMKRKISSLHPAAFSDDSLSVTTAIKRKHLLKGSNIPTHTLPISPDSVIDSPTTATNSSDEENTHHVVRPYIEKLVTQLAFCNFLVSSLVYAESNRPTNRT